MFSGIKKLGGGALQVGQDAISKARTLSSNNDNGNGGDGDGNDEANQEKEEVSQNEASDEGTQTQGRSTKKTPPPPPKTGKPPKNGKPSKTDPQNSDKEETSEGISQEQLNTLVHTPGKPVALASSDSYLTISWSAPMVAKREEIEAMPGGKEAQNWKCGSCGNSNNSFKNPKTCSVCGTLRPLPLNSLLEPNDDDIDEASSEDSNLKLGDTDFVQKLVESGEVGPVEYEIQYVRHAYRLDSWKTIGPVVEKHYTITNLEPNQRYDVRIRARFRHPKKPPAASSSSSGGGLWKKKKENKLALFEWSKPCDTVTFLTLSTVDQQRLENLERVTDFLEGRHQPFEEDSLIPDTLSDKAVRSMDGILYVARWAGVAPKMVRLAKEAWKLQKNGVAALLFHKDLQRMVYTLGSFVGSAAEVVGLSSKDVVVGSYYLLWEQRRRQLLDPERGKRSHQGPAPGLLEEEAPLELLREFAWFSPIAAMAYRSSPAQIQWLLDTFPSRITKTKNKSELSRKESKQDDSQRRSSWKLPFSLLGGQSDDHDTASTKHSSASEEVEVPSMWRRRRSTRNVDEPAPSKSEHPKAQQKSQSQQKSNSATATATATATTEAAHAPPPGYRLIACNSTAKEFKPAFFLAAHESHKMMILSIRGTKDVDDVLTDGLCDVDEAPFHFHEGGSDGEKVGPELRVHAGMLRAAQWMFRGDGNVLHTHRNNPDEGKEGEADHYGPSAGSVASAGSAYAGPQESGAGMGLAVEKFYKAGYKIVITGHSLGAGVGVILALLLADEHPDIKIRVVGFGTPACVDERVAEACKGEVHEKYAVKEFEELPDLGKRVTVTTLINAFDLVPRLSVLTAHQLAAELKESRPRWEPLLRQDLTGFANRAKTLWAPTQRAQALQRARPSDSVPVTLVEAEEENDGADNPPLKAALSVKDNQQPDKKADEKPDGKSDKKDSKKDARKARLRRNLETRLVPPGLIGHMYEYRSTDHVSLVDWRFEPLRSIETTMYMLEDHRLDRMKDVLRNVFAVRAAEAQNKFGPKWESLKDHYERATEVECAVCGYPVGWSLTGSSEMVEVRAANHCYCCGKICCADCISHTMSLPNIGRLDPARSCDDCRYKLVCCEGPDGSSFGLDVGEWQDFHG